MRIPYSTTFRFVFHNFKVTNIKFGGGTVQTYLEESTSRGMTDRQKIGYLMKNTGLKLKFAKMNCVKNMKDRKFHLLLFIILR